MNRAEKASRNREGNGNRKRKVNKLERTRLKYRTYLEPTFLHSKNKIFAKPFTEFFGRFLAHKILFIITNNFMSLQLCSFTIT